MHLSLAGVEILQQRKRHPINQNVMDGCLRLSLAAIIALIGAGIYASYAESIGWGVVRFFCSGWGLFLVSALALPIGSKRIDID
jgi:hypothetical protein